MSLVYRPRDQDFFSLLRKVHKTSAAREKKLGQVDINGYSALYAERVPTVFSAVYYVLHKVNPNI